jgi:hypothetical protein
MKELQSKMILLEEQVQAQAGEIEALNERIPDSNIISPNFLKRAFTVWGHYIVAGFIVVLPFLCLTMFFAFMTTFFSQQ